MLFGFNKLETNSSHVSNCVVWGTINMKHYFKPFAADRAGASAVEFAFVAPVFILLMLGIVCFGVLFGTYNGVEQLAAESARAAVAGLSAAERTQLAQNYVTANVGAYGFLNPADVTVTTSSQTTTFQVTINYDMSQSFIFKLGATFLTVNPTITRSAAIQNGGF
jgi:Flp pilus assembly protein TadG